MKKLIIGLVSILAVGCKNPYVDFYHDMTGGQDLSKVVEQGNGSPKAYRGQTPEIDDLNMMENNYVMLGYSAFNGGNVDTNGAFSQAEKVHASVIIVYDPHYTNTRSGSMPLLVPNNQTTYSSGTATAYGNGGSVTAYGSGVSTTYSNQVVNVPFSQNRYDYTVSYWARSVKPILFGARWRDLNPEERSKLGTNKGVVLIVVIKGSPAFRADFMRGDIIRKVDGREVMDSRDISDIIGAKAGQAVKVELQRNGEAKEIQVILNPRS